jgi:hypothetical protein
MSKITQIIEQEIATVKAQIDRHQGVGCYQDNCRVWGYHLEAYETILHLVTQAQLGRKRVSSRLTKL